MIGFFVPYLLGIAWMKYARKRRAVTPHSAEARGSGADNSMSNFQFIASAHYTSKTAKTVLLLVYCAAIAALVSEVSHVLPACWWQLPTA